ncbi:MAG: diaminobutyrate acetyltransferase [Burkholderiaceae bacterium]
MTDTDPSTARQDLRLQFRTACPADGAALWRLVKATGTLELNSAYFYLVFATDFGDTCLVAEYDGDLVGTVIGYRPPRHPDHAFVWQVGVLPALRGQGLGRRLLDEWRALPALQDCRWLTATVSPGNEASRALFTGFARLHGVGCTEVPHFDSADFPVDHPPEPLLRIGPFAAGAPRRLMHAA